jgi:Lon protease-like protein
MSAISARLTARELSALPVFPLPNVVMFPSTQLPLHLFEPRYRAMVEHCVAVGPQTLAVAQLRSGWEPEYENRPAIHEIAGAGRIIAHERRRDGTYDIMLQAICRVRLTESESPHPFRVARAEVLADIGGDDVSAIDVTGLVALASEVAGLLHRAQPDFSLGLKGDESPAMLANCLANRCIVDAVVRQRVLEAVHVPARVRLVTSALAELHLSLARHSGRPSAC